jgi:GH25 family lysozyme M1 (1,4-beta-N-acetylmuramidase)
MADQEYYGIDLSHHQSVAAVNWEAVKENCQFVMVRAAYGLSPDKLCQEHVRRARAAGCLVGLYTFFRQSQDFTEQLRVFEGVLTAARIGPGDIYPAIDIETDPVPRAQMPQPAWNGPCEAYAVALQRLYGGCLLYMTQRDWHMMGSPSWVKKHYLWAPHWRARGQQRWPAIEPAVPEGMTWSLHQFGCGPVIGRQGLQDDTALGAFDHNRAKYPLPVIRNPGDTPTAPESMSVPSPVCSMQQTVQAQITRSVEMDWDAFRAARNAALDQDP